MGTEGQAVAGGKERPDQDQNQGSFYRFLLPFAEQFLIINTDLTSNFQYSCKPVSYTHLTLPTKVNV